MKKFLLFLLTMMLGFSTLQMSAQQVVDVIGDGGTTTNSYLPIYTLYNNTLSEQIYTADEIGMGGTITSIAFYNGGSEKTPNVKIYMINTDQTSFTSTTDWLTVTASDLVFDGVVTFTADAWTTITLDNPFDYDGASNFGLIVDGNLSWSSGLACRVFNGTTNCAMYVYSDPTDYDAVGATYTASSRLAVKNQLRLEIMPSGSNCYGPTSPAISNVTAYEATLSWTPRDGQTAWEVYCGTGDVDLDQVTWTPVTDTFYTFMSLIPATNYTAYVRTDCGAEVSNPRQVAFTTEATCASVPSNVTVSNITETTVDVSWTAGTDDSAWEVVVVPANATPESGTPEQTTAQPYTFTGLQDNTQYKAYVRTDCGGGDHSYWSSPKSFTTIPYCSSPLNVTISQITANSALVSWRPATYGATSYTVEYSFASEENWTMATVDGTQLMLSGLEPDSTYNVMVYSNCDLGTADTVHKDFTTRHCLVGGDIAIGEGTSTSTYVPSYSFYNYGYSQQLFTAAEIGTAGTLHSLSLNMANLSQQRTYAIYLAHTTASSLSSSWITPVNPVQVFSGNQTLTTGWNTFTFTTPFEYNGTDNLLLIILDNTGSYVSGNSWYSHSISGMARYIYQDGSAYSATSVPSSSGSSSSLRNNVVFGGECDNDATCVRPNVYVTETSENSITLDWAPGDTESAWDVEYSTDNTTWTSDATVNTHPYEVTGLNSDTKYYFRVRSNCGSEESDWSSANARTACGPITQLPYFNNFDEVISVDGTNFITCWTRYTTNPDRVVRCYGSATHSGSYALDFNYSPSCTTAVATPMIDASIPLNTVMLDFWAYSSLGQGWMEVGTMSDPNDFSTYEFYDTVRLSAASTWENLIIDFSNYTGNNQYIAFLEINGTSTSYIFDDFTIAYSTNCLHPTSLAVDDLTNTTVTLSWTEAGSATSWGIEYGPVGFTPGTGTTVSAGTNSFTVDNLTPATTYDFYVYADCGSEQSTPFGPVSATPGQYIMGQTGSDTLTTCGLIIYDNGGPDGNYTNNYDFTLVLYPENPNAMMALNGTSNTEGNNYDYIRIYDGVGTSGTQLAYHTGQNQTVNAISQSGPLTLVFHSDGSNVYSGIALIASCVTCYPPTNVSASNPTLDGATVTWSGMGDSYVLFLNGDMTTGYEANDTTYTFSGLNPSTVYSVQVASICNGDTSMLSEAAVFATACNAIPITSDEPWTENFENYQGSGAQTLVCWSTPVTTTFDNGTFPTAYCNYAASCHSGSNSIEFKGNNGAVNIAVLPEFTNSLHELRLSFWATATSTSNGIMEVGVMTDPTDTSTFELVDVCGTPGSRGSSSATVGSFGNFMGTFDFNNTLATTGRIALRFTSTSSSLSWNLDDFTVELIPNCPSPVKTSVRAINIGGHVATIYWEDEDDTHSSWTVYYRASNAGNDDPWLYTAATDTFVQLTGLDPETSYDVYVITNCATPDANPDATFTINFTTTVACPAPTGLTLANVSTDGATITWNGTASSYNVEYGITGFTPGTGTEDIAYTESYTLSNLTPSTSYTIYVNSDCTDANDSLSTTVSFTFTTTQIPADLPYTADFTAANEWILNNGSCTNYWATGTVNATPSLFVTNNGTTPGYSTGNASVVSAEKLLAVGDNASININFDVYVGGESSWDYLKVFFAPAETDYPATSTTVPAYASYTYDVNAVNFQNYLSQTGYTSYPYKLNLTNDTLHIAVEIANPYENPTTSSAAKLVFLWRNDGSSGTTPGAIISNVVVSVNTCPMPSDLAVDNITSNSADVTWTAGDNETEWELEYGPHGFAHGAGTVEPVSGTPEYSLSNLTSGTTYDIYVRAICSADDSSSWVGPVIVSPGTYNLPTSGTHSITTCELTIYDDGGPTDNYSNNCEVTLTINPGTPGNLVSISGTVNLEGNNYDYLYVYDGATTAGTQLGYYTGQNHTLTNLTSTTGPLTLRFHSDGSSTYSGIALTVTCVSNTCPTPTDLTVANITTNSADISWTAGGSESAWVFEYKEASASTWTEVPVTNPSYQLTGLTALTAYDVRVKADCGSGDESAYRSTSFNTTSCAISDQCAYTFVAGDGYGDGWNDGYLTVEQNGVVVATVEAINHSLSDTQTYDSIVVNLCDGISTNLVWHIGNFDDEISITLIGPDGSQLYTVSDLEENYSNPLYTFTTDCAGSGPVITDPTVATNAATAVNQTSATLNATINNPSSVTISAKGFEWKATNGGTYTQIAGTGTGNTFTANLTGLTANTSYTFKAFITFNGTTVYGSEMTFVTPETPVDPCDAPTNLQITNITQTSAVMTWTAGGDETSWKVGYKLSSATQWQEATVATTTYTIEGLTAASTYDVRVKAVCANSESDFITSSFTTEGVGIDNITLASSINLMPNPADNYIELTINSNVEVKEAVVFNAFGQMIQTVELNNNHARIDLSNMASGMYFVRVSGDNATATKKFIRK